MWLQKLVIEIKSVGILNNVQLAQALTDMKLGNYKRGLQINFNVAKLKDGTKRIIHGILRSLCKTSCSLWLGFFGCGCAVL
ncbi:MAG: hypothetical protein HBSAPP01_12090 [Candidatus Brocadia sapporoensis]|uniref:GxxExxY protein n=1 Tax=Candidatus Brocadia sapporoensis TaxID=392547 RepID=UPI0008634B01|nr:MAG: hypothetical protein HBSAPP01_12090 [Candidatus Brocadia sapporoensis]